MGDGSDSPKWDELFADALGLIFKKLEFCELLTVIPCVCKSWRKVVMGPYCWQEIDIRDWSCRTRRDYHDVDRMLQLLLPRSGGSLRALSVTLTSNDSLLIIASHSQSLQTLDLTDSAIEDVAIERAAPMLSTITSLDLSSCVCLGSKAFQAIGEQCNSLTSFRRTMGPGELTNLDDDEAQAIASSMPHLKKLEIPHLHMDTSGIVKILESCKHLELLDIRGCSHVDLDDEFLKRFPKLKVLGPGPRAGYDMPWKGDDFDYDLPSGSADYDFGDYPYGGYFDYIDYDHHDVMGGGVVIDGEFYPCSDDDW